MKRYERFILSLLWSIASICFLGYTLVHYGSKIEILTLLIGVVGGTIVGGIFGHYFTTTHKSTVVEENESKPLEINNTNINEIENQ